MTHLKAFLIIAIAWPVLYLLTAQTSYWPLVHTLNGAGVAMAFHWMWNRKES